MRASNIPHTPYAQLAHLGVRASYAKAGTGATGATGAGGEFVTARNLAFPGRQLASPLNRRSET